MSLKDTFVQAKTAFAIVSPCSSCKNQRDADSDDGKPACPRRKWIKEQNDKQSQGGKPDERLIPLTLTGMEDAPTDSQDGNTLRNPVYSDEHHSVLVWVATLRDNTGVIDDKGKVITPQILDPAFDTDWIQCRPFPYFPSDTEAHYFQKGGFKEGDQVVVTHMANSQYYLSQTKDEEGNDEGYKSVLVDGVVAKVDFTFDYPRKKVEKDECPQGT